MSLQKLFLQSIHLRVSIANVVPYMQLAACR